LTLSQLNEFGDFWWGSSDEDIYVSQRIFIFPHRFPPFGHGCKIPTAPTASMTQSSCYDPPVHDEAVGAKADIPKQLNDLSPASGCRVSAPLEAAASGSPCNSAPVPAITGASEPRSRPIADSPSEVQLSPTEARAAHVEGLVAASANEAPGSPTEHVADPPSCPQTGPIFKALETTGQTPCPTPAPRAHVTSFTPEAGAGSSNRGTDGVDPLDSEKSLTDIEMALKATKDVVAEPSSGHFPVLPPHVGEKIHRPVRSTLFLSSFLIIAMLLQFILRAQPSALSSTIGHRCFPATPIMASWCL
jgi:hypothetical protein